MAIYQHKDVSLEAPDGWAERTMVSFSAPRVKGEPPTGTNFVMTHESLPEGDSLRSYADRQLIDMGRGLKEFDILDSRERLVGGRRAIFFLLTWSSSFGALEQAMVIVDGLDGKIVVFTSTSLEKTAPESRKQFARMLDSVKFGSPAAPPPTSPSLYPPPSVPTSGAGPDSIMPIPMPGSRRR